MKKIYFMVICMVILIFMGSCSGSKQLPEGIQLIDDIESHEVEVLSMMKYLLTLEELVGKSDELVKLTINECNYFTYEWADKYGNIQDVPASSYTVEIVQTYGKSELKSGDLVVIYTEHSPFSYRENDVNPQIDNTYIMFLSAIPDRMPEGLRKFADYYIFDSEYAIFPCIDSEDCLVNTAIIYNSMESIKTTSFSTGNRSEINVNNYTNYEILPQNEWMWKKVNLAEFEAVISSTIHDKESK